MKFKFLLVLLFLILGSSCSKQEPVDLVNPNIGGISILLKTTVPLVNLPNSMMRIHRLPGNYQSEKIKGFPFIVCGHRNGTAGLLMPVSGDRPTDQEKWQSYYDHDFEVCKPYYYSVWLEDPDINPEFTVTEKSSYYQISWNKFESKNLMLLDTWFTNSPFGIPGDEDGGGLSAFVVFSSMGFYPVTPGTNDFNIGSPVFTDVTVRLRNSKTFRIIAKNSNRQNKFIQGATLNGRLWNKPWFSWEDIKDGGELILEMDSRPNYRWGSGSDDVPPSGLSE